MVVANTDPSLTTTDTFRDSEPSLAVNSSNANQLAAYSFSSNWDSGNAAVWYTSNGGTTWTKEFTLPAPTGVTPESGCPCDVTLDYDRSSRLFGTTLNFFQTVPTGDVYTGETTDPTSAAAWSWYAPGGTAQKTDRANSGAGYADQPWLRINRDPVTAGQDDAYVAYDDLTAGAVHVAAAPGSVPPNFTVDNVAGAIGCCVNAGARLGADHSNGTMYLLWQYGTGVNADGSKAVWYALTRSTDGGATWSLNGSASGIVVVAANSDQVSPKFGGVNALRGGIDAISVDPSNGDVYIVYGTKDGTTGNNRLAIRRLTSDGTGGLSIGSEHFVTGQVQAALPSVAVASNGAIGVLYDTYDGNDASGYPIFTVHLAQSTDHSVSFSDVPLVTFHSPELPDPNDTESEQRVLGDYQQLRSLGTTFYGAFPANGAAFGRSLANIDPIFLKAPANVPAKHVVADFDGNGTTDVAVYRPSTGVWFVRNQFSVAWGASGDITVPGDYDGNGTTDVAVYRPSTGVWYVRNQVSVAWGASTDIPLPLPNAIYRNFFS
jgi:hypothetical protein